MTNLKVGCVVMAAGLSTRFGQNKLLVELDGRSLIRRALDAVPSDKLDRVIVVTCFPEIQALAEAGGLEYVWNSRPEDGISLTIRLGLKRLRDFDAVMFMTSDQAWLSRTVLSAMVDFYCGNPGNIVSMSYGGVRGNPCIFPSVFFPELLALRGDTGGSAVIRRHEELLVLFEAGSANELKDIDIPSDIIT